MQADALYGAWAEEVEELNEAASPETWQRIALWARCQRVTCAIPILGRIVASGGESRANQRIIAHKQRVKSGKVGSRHLVIREGAPQRSGDRCPILPLKRGKSGEKTLHACSRVEKWGIAAEIGCCSASQWGIVRDFGAKTGWVSLSRSQLERWGLAL